MKDATEAITKFNGFAFGGKCTLKVKLATPKSQTNAGSGAMHENILWGGDSESDTISNINENVEQTFSRYYLRFSFK